MSLDDDLRSIRTQIAQVNQKRAQATVQAENAEAAVDTAKASLLSEFNVETSEDARRVQAELEAELNAAVAEVREQLAQAGA